jgi:Exportin-T
VALVYLETVTKYMKFVQENTQYIPHLLRAFLDERGIHHSNVYVSRRASYLFMRAVKLLKTKLVPYLDTILQVIFFGRIFFYLQKFLLLQEVGIHLLCSFYLGRVYKIQCQCLLVWSG